MKKLSLLLALCLPLASGANMLGGNDVFLFKNYPLNMHRTDFVKTFRYFGKCQFSMEEEKLCAEKGAESLYGIPFYIVVHFEKNRTHKIVLKTADPIKKPSYLELFRGMIKSGFELYEIKDEAGKVNIYEEIFTKGSANEFEGLANSKLDLLESETDKTNEATLFYAEHSKMQKTLKSGRKFSVIEDVFSQAPADTRFVEMKVSNYKGIYDIELIFTVPNTPIITIDDRPAEKF